MQKNVAEDHKHFIFRNYCQLLGGDSIGVSELEAGCPSYLTARPALAFRPLHALHMPSMSTVSSKILIIARRAKSISASTIASLLFAPYIYTSFHSFISFVSFATLLHLFSFNPASLIVLA